MGYNNDNFLNYSMQHNQYSIALAAITSILVQSYFAESLEWNFVHLNNAICSNFANDSSQQCIPRWTTEAIRPNANSKKQYLVFV